MLRTDASTWRAEGRRPVSEIAAVSLAILTVALGVATAALHLIAIAEGRATPPGDYWLFNAVVALAFSVSGAAIVRQRPRNPIGWAFIAGGLGNGLAGVGGQYAVLTGDPIGYWLYSWAWIPLPVALAVTLNTFPTGRTLTPRWWLPVVIVVLYSAVAMSVRATSGWMEGDPLVYPGAPLVLAWPAWIVSLWPLTLLAATVAGIASVVVRYRRSRGDEREQLKWLVVASVPFVVTFVGGFGNVLVSTTAVLLIAIPVAFGILRFRLYNIDLIINRALVYGVLGLLVATAYLVLATALGRVVGGDGSPATATMATVLAALVALVAHQTVQHAIDRHIYGRRRDPLAVVGSIARRLESAGAPEGLLAAVVGDLREALKVDAIAVYGVDDALLAGSARAEGGSRLPLSHQGEIVGELRIWTSRGDGLQRGDLAMLHDLGPQLAVAIEAIRLKRDLQRARERLVVALEEERRRVRRDLHDGLGPTLTAIALRADAATNLFARDPARSLELLAELRAAAGAAIAEVRQVVHGLRPPALDELGLVGAIREQAVGFSEGGVEGVAIIVEDGSALPALPAAVEVAAYRIAIEAITNAARHAGARRCRVTIFADTALEVEVTDDGHGWDGRLTPGVGIQSMQERAADLGGTLTIERVAGGGTTVLARLPLTIGGAS